MNLPAMAPASCAGGMAVMLSRCWADRPAAYHDRVMVVCGQTDGLDSLGLCPGHAAVLRRWPPDSARAAQLEAP